MRSLLEKIEADLKKYEDISYNENPFIHRNWETHNLGVNNFFTDLETLLKQLEVKIVQEKMKANPNNKKLKESYKKLKNEFREITKTRGYVD